MHKNNSEIAFLSFIIVSELIRDLEKNVLCQRESQHFFLNCSLSPVP